MVTECIGSGVSSFEFRVWGSTNDVLHTNTVLNHPLVSQLGALLVKFNYFKSNLQYSKAQLWNFC